MTLEELLEELVKADPDRFQKHVVFVGGAWEEIYNSPALQLWTISRLEYALREAIEARGWEWETKKRRDESYVGCVTRSNYEIMGLAFTTIPAIALGMAYLKAIGGAV